MYFWHPPIFIVAVAHLTLRSKHFCLYISSCNPYLVSAAKLMTMSNGFCSLMYHEMLAVTLNFLYTQSKIKPESLLVFFPSYPITMIIRFVHSRYSSILVWLYGCRGMILDFMLTNEVRDFGFWSHLYGCTIKCNLIRCTIPTKKIRKCKSNRSTICFVKIIGNLEFIFMGIYLACGIYPREFNFYPCHISRKLSINCFHVKLSVILIELCDW